MRERAKIRYRLFLYPTESERDIVRRHRRRSKCAHMLSRPHFTHTPEKVEDLPDTLKTWWHGKSRNRECGELHFTACILPMNGLLCSSKRQLIQAEAHDIVVIDERPGENLKRSYLTVLLVVMVRQDLTPQEWRKKRVA